MTNYDDGIKKRVFDAANSLETKHGRAPTVNEVRQVARCDMHSASALMREWRRSKEKTVEKVEIVVPEEVKNVGEKAIQEIWATAQSIANKSLEAAQKDWNMERAKLENESQAVSDEFDALDKSSSEKEKELLEEIVALKAKLAEQTALKEKATAEINVLIGTLEGERRATAVALDSLKKTSPEKH